ncbi:MAG: hypothetical protein ACSHW7_02245 [Patiriisocius sp.]|uniref:hypothetical protein n=1 Tax=Patiriisocius sp. TaxID=2822396 RepID=UPI003EF2D249
MKGYRKYRFEDCQLEILEPLPINDEVLALYHHIKREPSEYIEALMEKASREEMLMAEDTIKDYVLLAARISERIIEGQSNEPEEEKFLCKKQTNSNLRKQESLPF